MENGKGRMKGGKGKEEGEVYLVMATGSGREKTGKCKTGEKEEKTAGGEATEREPAEGEEAKGVATGGKTIKREPAGGRITQKESARGKMAEKKAAGKTAGRLRAGRRKGKIGVCAIVLGCMLSVFGIGAFSLAAVRESGRRSLREREQNITPQMENRERDGQEAGPWEAGWIKYEGNIYCYNEEILTFLFMGIDKDNAVQKVEEGTDGGQADALFLLVLNPKNKTVQVIAINRNAMVDVRLYDSSGAYLSTVQAQIAVQHGFGDGVEESCEYQREAVRRLFYHLPIHGYCAVNMDAIITLTDLVGGIELTSLEDVTSAIQDETLGDYVVNEGETVLLDGRKAYSYVRYRAFDEMGSANRRLERQKQFLGEWIRKIKGEVKEDVTLAVRLYEAVAAQTVTDISVDEILYLAGLAADYQFSMEQFYTLQGETVQGEEFEEFYVDEDALYRMMVEVFYEPVDG